MQSPPAHFGMRLLGVALVAAAAAMNEWWLGAFFSPDGTIDNPHILWLIRTFQFLAVLGGGAALVFPRSMLRWMCWGLDALQGLSRRPLLIVCLAVLLGLTLRGALIATKRSITHDEAFSYLTATGHHGEFRHLVAQKQHPYGRWVPVEEWKRLISVEDRFPLRRIRNDLAEHDYHPPLYFWLLHAFALLVGISTWTGPLLNMLIFPAGVLALYGLGRRASGSDRLGALGAFLWAMSPAVLHVAPLARPYELFAFLTIAFAWQLFRCLPESPLRAASPDRPAGSHGQGTTDGAKRPPERCRRETSDRQRSPRWYDHILLALITAAGMLTHYHFAIVAAGGGLLLLWHLGRNRQRSLWGSIAALGAGGGLFVAAHPVFWKVFHRPTHGQTTVSYSWFLTRLQNVWFSLLYFFSHVQVGQLGAFAVVCLLLGYVAARKWIFNGSSEESPFFGKGRRASLLFLVVWVGGCVIVLYLTFVTQVHAMGARYLAHFWPFPAILLVAALDRLDAGRGRVVACAAVLMCLSGLTYTLHRCAITRPRQTISKPRSVLIDNTSPGHLPRILWHLPAGCRVYAARPGDLLGDKERWMRELDGGGVYITAEAYGMSVEERRRLRRFIRSHYHVERALSAGLGTTYVLRGEERGKRKSE